MPVSDQVSHGGQFSGRVIGYRKGELSAEPQCGPTQSHGLLHLEFRISIVAELARVWEIWVSLQSLDDFGYPKTWLKQCTSMPNHWDNRVTK